MNELSKQLDFNKAWTSMQTWMNSRREYRRVSLRMLILNIPQIYIVQLACHDQFVWTKRLCWNRIKVQLRLLDINPSCSMFTLLAAKVKHGTAFLSPLFSPLLPFLKAAPEGEIRQILVEDPEVHKWCCLCWVPSESEKFYSVLKTSLVAWEASRMLNFFTSYESRVYIHGNWWVVPRLIISLVLHRFVISWSVRRKP